MPLTCSCDLDDDCSWYFNHPNDYILMPPRLRRARCRSCHTLINYGETVAEFTRSRVPRSDYEAYRFGEGPEAIPLATWYLCEGCADLYFSLYELGYECIAPNENMRELVREYAELRGEGE